MKKYYIVTDESEESGEIFFILECDLFTDLDIKDSFNKWRTERQSKGEDYMIDQYIDYLKENNPDFVFPRAIEVSI